MKREEILSMEAGPEMNALVAEKAMGESYPDRFAHPKWWSLRYDHIGHEIWVAMPFSENIAAAWEVVEKLREENIAILITTMGPRHEVMSNTIINQINGPACWAETAPLAICRAALLAMLEESS